MNAAAVSNPSFAMVHWKNGEQSIRIMSGDVSPSRLRIAPGMDRRVMAQVIEYRLCEMMGMAGFSYKAIGRTLGLSKTQVKGRLRRLGKLSVKAYRDGETPLAKQVIARLDEVAQRKLVENLERYLLR